VGGKQGGTSEKTKYFVLMFGQKEGRGKGGRPGVLKRRKKKKKKKKKGKKILSCLPGNLMCKTAEREEKHKKGGGVNGHEYGSEGGLNCGHRLTTFG